MIVLNYRNNILRDEKQYRNQTTLTYMNRIDSKPVPN